MEIEAAIGGGHGEVEVEKGVVTSRENGDAAYLVWENLKVVIPNFGNGPTKRLLNGVHGYAQPGRITAIMGPSGSGKSTLLDALAGRLSGNLIMNGNVFLNGRKQTLDYGVVAYVTQEDILMGTLTVRETITYSAQLRLPSSMSKEEVSQIINNTIMEMGLQECADQIIGNWHLRGISGGEKKRLSIALEILTKPRLLFLDEPTSGLDSASAFFVVQVLKNVAACGGGRTIISSIHQPSSEVFALFDDLSLLSGGETIYFGEATAAVQFFADSGFPCSSRKNPSDHFLRCINTDFDDVNATLMESRRFSDVEKSPGGSLEFKAGQIKARLAQEYKFSKYAAAVRARIQEILSIEGLGIGKTVGSEARWYKQLSTLTRRSFTNMSRDFGYYWLRIIVYILVAICVGTVFYDVGTNYRAILARGACGGFMSGYMTFMSIGGFPSFIEEMKIFHKERLNGHYGVGVFVISNLLSSFPFLFVMSISSISIAYNLVKFHHGFSRFIYASLDLLCSIAVVESLMMVVASIVPNFLMGLIVGAGLIGIMMATAGFFRSIPDLPKLLWRYPISYLNYMAWGLEGAYKNDMIGLEFDPLSPGEPKLEGEIILRTILGISPDFSKWWDLAAVVIIFICCRLLFYSILKFRERATPMVRRLYVKRIQQHISKRPSFRKTIPPFSSKRHHTVLRSLSSQEGLNSPIH